jgi:hypothetical protein
MGGKKPRRKFLVFRSSFGKSLKHRGFLNDAPNVKSTNIHFKLRKFPTKLISDHKGFYVNSSLSN